VVAWQHTYTFEAGVNTMRTIQILLGVIAIMLLTQAVSIQSQPESIYAGTVETEYLFASKGIALYSEESGLGGFMSFQEDGGVMLKIGLNDSQISMKVGSDGTPTLFISRPDNNNESIFLTVQESGAGITVGGLKGSNRINITTIGETDGAQVSVESTQKSGELDLTGFRVASATNASDELVEMFITEEGGQLLTWNEGAVTGFVPFPVGAATAAKPTTWGQIKKNPSVAMPSNRVAKRAFSNVDMDALRREHEAAINKAESNLQR
jgi:hypothetical protein